MEGPTARLNAEEGWSLTSLTAAAAGLRSEVRSLSVLGMV